MKMSSSSSRDASRVVVVVVVVVARDVVAVPHARCPRVHRAWTRAEVWLDAIAVRVAVCRVESNRIRIG